LEESTRLRSSAGSDEKHCGREREIEHAEADDR
jgi:hypothetical protein